MLTPLTETLVVFQEFIYVPNALDCQQNVPEPSKVNGAIIVDVTGLQAPPPVVGVAVNGTAVRVGEAPTVGVLLADGVFVRVAVRVGVLLTAGVFVRVAEAPTVGVRVGEAPTVCVGVLVIAEVKVRVGVLVEVKVIAGVWVRVGVAVAVPPLPQVGSLPQMRVLP